MSPPGDRRSSCPPPWSRGSFLCFPHLFTYLPHPSPVHAAIIDSDVLAVARVASSSVRRECPAVVTRALNELLLLLLTIVANLRLARDRTRTHSSDTLPSN